MGKEFDQIKFSPKKVRTTCPARCTNPTCPGHRHRCEKPIEHSDECEHFLTGEWWDPSSGGDSEYLPHTHCWIVPRPLRDRSSAAAASERLRALRQQQQQQHQEQEQEQDGQQR